MKRSHPVGPPDPRVKRRLAAVLALSLAASTGCTATIGGEAVPDPAATKIDTGNFPTTPRTVAAVTPGDAWQQEALIMADSVVAPFDIRPTLSKRATAISMLTGPITLVAGFGDDGSSKSLALIPTDKVIALGGFGYQTGFLATAADSTTNPTAFLSIGLLRFYSPESATQALAIMRDDKTTAPAGLDAVADAVPVSAGDRAGLQRVTVAARRGNLIALTAAAGPTAVEAGALAVEALTAQVAKATSYRQNGVLSPTAVPSVPMDKDGIMSRTLASPATDNAVFGLSPRVAYFEGYYSRRTRYMVNLLPEWLNSAEANGIDLIAETKSAVVMRARDHDAAVAFVRNKGKGGGVDTSANVFYTPGIPRDNVLCGRESNADKTKYTCYLILGRWTVQVHQSTLQLAQQAISAEYLINKAAGEN
ncbi:hypothetical protein LB823_17780 [Tsukamurella sp. M9C]|uniref:DUF7373 family lipoprotein n=1 Tax=unclassified Tsukamurella TaxID=2633480 RepID=UPI001CCFF630|nr:hypothetical protein [Tsukamurella sp. M9C]MCA0158048.1 hypothetical protein [Tsukamurella sp. M9C]